MYGHAQFATVGRTSSMSGAMAPLNAWSPPSAQEQQFYETLFAAADEEKRDAIGGRIAVAFFSRSGVDKALLREIWTIANSQQRSELSRNEFYVAMRLISMAQRGEAISAQRFHELASLPFPLPSLAGIPPPQAVPPLPVQTLGAPTAQTAKSYAITDEEKQRYDGIFKQYDTDRDGFLHGSEAVQLFGMSGLDRGILRDIWALADRGQDSRLDNKEFYVAMHLIVCISKRGLPLPTELPPDLAESVFGVSAPSSFTSQTIPTGSDSGSHSRTNSVSINAPIVTQPPVVGSPSPAQQQVKRDPMDAFANISGLEPTLSHSNRVTSFNGANSSPTYQLQGGSALSSRLSTTTLQTHTTVESTAVHLHPAASLGTNPVLSTSAFGSANVSVTNAQFSSPLDAGILTEPNRDRAGSSSSVSSFASVSTDTSTAYSASNSHVPPQQSTGFVSMGNIHPHIPTISPSQFVPGHAPLKPFLSSEDESSAVSQLDKSNEELVLVVQSIEKKQDAMSLLLNKLGELDQLRHELVALSVKRDTVRAATSPPSDENAKDAHAIRAVEQTLRELIEGEKTAIHKLQSEIAKFEVELAQEAGQSSGSIVESGRGPNHSMISPSQASVPSPLLAPALETTPKNDFEAFDGFGSSSPAPDTKGYSSHDAFANLSFS